MSITTLKRATRRGSTAAGGDSAATSRTLPSKPSQKIGAVALSGAISTVLWTLLAAYVTTSMPKEVIATLTGATTTIFAFALGYLISD